MARTLILLDGTKLQGDVPIGVAEAMREATVKGGLIHWPDGTSGAVGHIAIRRVERDARRYAASLAAFGLIATPEKSADPDFATWAVRCEAIA